LNFSHKKSKRKRKRIPLDKGVGFGSGDPFTDEKEVGQEYLFRIM